MMFLGRVRKPMHLRAKPGPKPNPNTQPSRNRPRWIGLILHNTNTGSRAKSGDADRLANAAIADINNAANLTRLNETWRLWQSDVDVLDLARKDRVHAARCKRREQLALVKRQMQLLQPHQESQAQRG